MACQYDSHKVTPADCSASFVGDQQDRVAGFPWSTYGAVTAATIPALLCTGLRAPQLRRLQNL